MFIKTIKDGNLVEVMDGLTTFRYFYTTQNKSIFIGEINFSDENRKSLSDILEAASLLAA